MDRKLLLGGTVVCLLIALVAGLLFNGIPVIKNMPTWVKTSYMNIWVPALLGVVGLLGLYKGFKTPITPNKNSDPNAVAASTNTLTLPLNQNNPPAVQSKQSMQSKQPNQSSEQLTQNIVS